MEKKINIEKIKQVTLVACGVLLLAVGFINYKNVLDEIEIMNIVIKNNKRGQGIASNLLSYVIRKEKANKINLEVNEKNRTAINLYSRFGFRKVGRRAKYYNGQDDAILMTL